MTAQNADIMSSLPIQYRNTVREVQVGIATWGEGGVVGEGRFDASRV